MMALSEIAICCQVAGIEPGRVWLKSAMNDLLHLLSTQNYGRRVCWGADDLWLSLRVADKLDYSTGLDSAAVRVTAVFKQHCNLVLVVNYCSPPTTVTFITAEMCESHYCILIAKQIEVFFGFHGFILKTKVLLELNPAAGTKGTPGG